MEDPRKPQQIMGKAEKWNKLETKKVVFLRQGTHGRWRQEEQVFRGSVRHTVSSRPAYAL